MLKTIRSKLYAGFGGIFVIVTISQIVSLLALNTFTSNYNQFRDVQIPLLQLANDIRYYDSSLTNAVQTKLIDRANTTAHEQYAADAAILDEALNSAKELASTDEMRQIFERIDQYNTELVTVETSLLDQPNITTAMEHVRGRYGEVKALYASEIENFYTIQNAVFSEEQQRISQRLRFLQGLSLGLGALAAIIAASVAFTLSSQISSPLAALMHAAQRVSEGDLYQQVSIHTNDELSRLAAIFNTMISNLRSTLESQVAKEYLQGILARYQAFVEQLSAGDFAARLTLAESSAQQVEDTDNLAVFGANLNEMAETLEAMMASQITRESLEHIILQYKEFVAGVASGDLSIRLPLSQMDVADVSEDLRDLGISLNQMVESLSTVALQVRQAASSMTAAAAEIQASTTMQASAAAEQNATVMQTVATVEQIRATVEQTANRAGAVTTSSQQSIAVSQVGLQATVESVEGMRAIQERVADIAENILMLSERTQQIGEIIETVNGLADQSKLLALNASIEAARAGEEGRGFAVVAMEVRQLAEQSREATARVRDILGEIQQATNTAVMVTEEGSKVAESGMSLVERAGGAIQNLAQRLEEAEQLSTQIAASTQQQTGGMEQLLAAMHQIRQATIQTAASTRQTEQSMVNLMQIANQLESAAAGYRLS